MKVIDLNLLSNTGTSYDQTRTTLAGRVTQRTIDSKQVLGPSPTRWIDVFQDTAGAFTPTSNIFVTENSRIFMLGAIAAGILPIVCYEFNQTSGAPTYVGRINVSMPNSPGITHTIRSLKVLDSGTTGWKIYVIATGTGLISGSGTILVNSINKSDFSQVSPPSISFATGNNQKAVYQLGRLSSINSRSMTVTLGTPVKFNFTAHGFSNNDQVYFTSQVGAAWPAATFSTNTKYFVRNVTANDFELASTFNGVSINAAAGPTSVVMQPLNQEIDSFGAIIDVLNNRLYTHVGSATNSQYFVRDISVAPTYSTQTANITLATPAKIQITAHGYTENEPVQFLAGSLPATFSLNTTYFIRNLTANDFELSSTQGGASIASATAATGVTVGKAFGYTDSQWLHKTSILPAISGSLLSTTDSESIATPTNAPLNGPLLNGQKCAFFATQNSLYLGRLDELTPETTTWPSLTTSNVLGSLNQIMSPTVFAASWSDTLDHAIIQIGSSGSTAYRFMLKKVENNKLTTLFGDVSADYYETTSRSGYELKTFSPPLNFGNNFGWIFTIGTGVGQRGLLASDIRSDCLFDHSYVVSKVVSLPQNSLLRSVKAFRELASQSGELDLSYRTSGFGSISGGWTSFNDEQELNIPSITQIQFKVCFKTHSIKHSSHAQISELFVSFETEEETSDNWEYSFDDSSSGVPTRSGFRLRQTYASSVPGTLTFRASDLSGVTLVAHNITANAANFQYSTDGGTTWLALGTVPNTVGTLIRYNFTSPPGVDVRVSLKDS